MSGVGGGSGGGGGGTGGASDDVAQGLDEVRAKIEKLDAVRNKLEVGSDAWTAVTKELAGLQEEKNRLAEQQQQREQQQQAQTQGGKCYPCSLSLSLPSIDFTMVAAVPFLCNIVASLGSPVPHRTNWVR